MMQLARRIGVQVARLADVGLTNIVVGPVCGSFTREEALTAVLCGTGLTYRFVTECLPARLQHAGAAERHNLTNEVYVAGIGGATGTAGSSGVDAFYGDPRTLGVSVRTRF